MSASNTSNMSLELILEAVLAAADRPLSLIELQALFAEPFQPTVLEISAALQSIQQQYRERALMLREVNSGWRFQVRECYSEWIARLRAERPARYSRALLETLALIVYRQPITRAEIEAVRGVSVSSQIIQTLLERQWIQVVGHRETPGRPALYGTTAQFLDDFCMQDLAQLPPLPALKDFGTV